MEASEGGYEECIKVLIKSAASLNVVNHDGYTALLFARVGGHWGARDLLSAHGAHHFWGLMNSVMMHNVFAVIVRKVKEITQLRYQLTAIVICASFFWRGDEPAGLASGQGRSAAPFWDYRHDLQAQQREFDIVICGMFSGPRYALHLLNAYIPASGRPAAEISWLEWVLVPELYIFRNRDLILGGLPLVVPSVLIATATLRIVQIVSLNTKKEFRKLTIRFIGWEVASFFVSFFSWYLYDLVCPFLPWSICESGVLVSAWIYFLAPVIRISFSGI